MPFVKANWGNWGEWQHCPRGGFVVGMRVKAQPFAWFTDNTGFNAIRLACSGGEVLKSAEGVHGTWTPWKFATNNRSIDTVYVRSQRPCGGCDDTATHGIRFRESTHINPQTHEPYTGYWISPEDLCIFGGGCIFTDTTDYTRYRINGYWASARCTGERIYFDPPGQYPRKVITGFRTQVEPYRGDGDDTGLNGVQFKCGYGD